MISKSFKEHIEEVDTFEGKFKNVILRNNHLIIPYINLAVSEHPLNLENKLKFLNFSYIVCLDILFLSTWIEEAQKEYIIIDRLKSDTVYNWGGENLNSNSIYNDIRICCKKAYLETLELSELSNDKWRIGNESDDNVIDGELAMDFFDGKFMPIELKKLID